MFVPWIQASCSQMSAIAICGSLWRPLAFLYWPSWACFLDFWKTQILPGCLSESTHFFDVAETHFFDVATNQGGEFFWFFSENPNSYTILHVPHKKWACFPALRPFVKIRVGSGGWATNRLTSASGSTPLEVVPWWVPVSSFGETTVNKYFKPKVADMYLLHAPIKDAWNVPIFGDPFCIFPRYCRCK